MYLPGAAPNSRPLAQTLRDPGAAKHELVHGSAPFCFRQLAAMARGPAVSQAKPLPKGSRRATGLSPGKSLGPRPIRSCARPRMSPAAPVPAASREAPAYRPASQGAKPCWSRLSAHAAQALRQPALSLSSWPA